MQSCVCVCSEVSGVVVLGLGGVIRLQKRACVFTAVAVFLALAQETFSISGDGYELRIRQDKKLKDKTREKPGIGTYITGQRHSMCD